MIQYHITIISKNKNSIKNFFIFFNQTLKNFNIIKKYLKKKHKKKILTILKSPHVNKIAQEQFETKQFINKINIYYSLKNLQFLVLLKKIKIYLFPDIKIKTKFIINKTLTKTTQYKILDPDNFKIKFFSKPLSNKNQKTIKCYKNKQYLKNNFNVLEQTKYLLNIYDLYGKIIKKYV